MSNGGDDNKVSHVAMIATCVQQSGGPELAGEDGEVSWRSDVQLRSRRSGKSLLGGNDGKSVQRRRNARALQSSGSQCCSVEGPPGSLLERQRLRLC